MLEHWDWYARTDDLRYRRRIPPLQAETSELRGRIVSDDDVARRETVARHEEQIDLRRLLQS